MSRSFTAGWRPSAREASLRQLGAMSFGVVLLAVVAVFATMAFGIYTLTRDTATQQADSQILQLSNAAQRRSVDIETGLRGYLVTRQRRFLQPYDRALAVLPGELAELARKATGAVDAARVRGIIAAIDAYERTYAAPLSRSDEKLSMREAIAVTSRGKLLMDALRARFRLFNAAEQRASTASEAASANGAREAMGIAGFGFLLIVGLLIAIAIYIARSVLRPVAQVAEAARSRGRGEVDIRAPERGIGEIARLGRSFNEMSDAREERERALLELTARLEGVLRHAEAIIYVKDAGGRYLVVNRAFEHARDLKAAEVIGRTELDFAPLELAARIAEDDRTVLVTGVPLSSEYTCPTPSGPRTFLSVKFRIPAPDGGEPTIGGVSTDVTVQKQALATAVEATRTKSDFLANMSHELRTPLNGVIGMAHLLADTGLSESQREYVDALEASGEALLAVIGHVLDFSKLEARKLELDPSDFDLHRLIHESCLIVGENARSKGLALERRVGEDVPHFVHGDRARLRQILLNLLSNAVKFTAAGEVAVTVSREDDGLTRFEVRDTGIGVSAEEMDELFSPFSQADASTTRKYGGTGLGLAIARELAELMGGRIGVRPAHGHGSVFWFTVSLAPASASSEIDARARRCGLEPGDTVPTVLIVEDNEVNQVVASRMLEQRGLHVEKAWNGAEGVAMAAERRYAAIFMDCQMPELDGYAATRLIRDGGASAEVPIIAMTAHSMSGGRERCLAAGMDDYLTKPLRPEPLDAVLSRWLSPGARETAAPESRAGLSETAETASAAEASEAAEAAASTLDEGVVAGLLDGFPRDAREELLDIFVASTEDSLAGMQSAFAAQDGAELRRLAHLLKGSGASMGARALSEACRDLEQQLGEAGAVSTADLDHIVATAEHSRSELHVALLDR